VWVGSDGGCPHGHPRSCLRGLHEVAAQPSEQPSDAVAVPTQGTQPAHPTSTSASAPVGWYPDPARQHQLRYWDGDRWTEHVWDAGSQSQDLLMVDRAALSDTGCATRGGVWRSGNKLVMLADAVLPDRCVKTNQPTDGKKVQVRLRWHDPLFYLLILVSLLVYAIVAAFASKNAVVWVGLSEAAAQSRRRALAITWALALSGVGTIVAMVVFGLNLILFLLGVVLIFVSFAVYAWGGARLVAPVRIKDGYVWLTGIHPDYLDLLPEWEQGPGRPQFT
jgi:Protein of unknown function (DUF2510)